MVYNIAVLQYLNIVSSLKQKSFVLKLFFFIYIATYYFIYFISVLFFFLNLRSEHVFQVTWFKHVLLIKTKLIKTKSYFICIYLQISN